MLPMQDQRSDEAELTEDVGVYLCMDVQLGSTCHYLLLNISAALIALAVLPLISLCAQRSVFLFCFVFFGLHFYVLHRQNRLP